MRIKRQQISKHTRALGNALCYWRDWLVENIPDDVLASKLRARLQGLERDEIISYAASLHGDWDVSEPEHDPRKVHEVPLHMHEDTVYIMVGPLDFFRWSTNRWSTDRWFVDHGRYTCDVDTQVHEYINKWFGDWREVCAMVLKGALK